ncbi:PPC domain-containing DNA-binding protein [Candidatus Villigracilis affinis]|uniref:PPC domain-containing DNA-binding protein n=1 Tax=Candidatus Villigracilis affinis TaxID=3140682 RepID=UPI0031EF5654
MKAHTFRLKPAQDLFDSIEEFAKQKNIQAGCVLSSVGSLTHATLRLANRSDYNEYDGHFEIVSMTRHSFDSRVTHPRGDLRWRWRDHRRASRQRVQNLHHG